MSVRSLAVLGFGAAVGGAVARRVAAAGQVDPQYRSAALLLPDVQLVRPMAALFRRVRPRPTAIADGVVATDRLVRARDGRGIRVWVYEAATDGAPVPAVLHVHGGGYVMGDPVASHARCSAIAAELGVRVVSVDYRLAPEHPFPAAIDDCVDVLAWMHASADAEGVDAARIAVVGDSAGGGLGACTAQAGFDLGLPVAFQALVYPMLDDRTRRRVDDRGRYAWPASSNRFAWDAYLAGAPGTSPYAAAARRADLAGLPPAWIGVGSLDLLHAEDLAYASRLRAAGVPVEVVEVPGAYHAFETLRPDAPGSQTFEHLLREALRAGLGLGAS
ncbi:alpha/beta hydrolase [Agrococcus jejuensis]|uniref:Acetyl esterase/lipase n=1 Tax=Agrococcus jejuensis TaxID=399736 RepID=A0A1G8CIL1_9MICO|nr:alpha/beta hydrolase [Agrococcus jejuensis]SDH45272.1 Acetyl esterase/lipase [Agrococcus jejuensis]